MYYMTTIEGTVRIPPYRFDEPLEDVAIETLNEEYIGQLDKNLGLMVGAFSIEEIGEGVLIMGDGAAYHNVVFNAIFFKPEQQEIVEYIDYKTTQIDKMIVELTYKVEYLKQYKQRLIADVVTGKINVQPE